MYGIKMYNSVMTRAGVPNDEFDNLALEEGILGIQTMEFDEFHPESGWLPPEFCHPEFDWDIVVLPQHYYSEV